jgi:hypothetical protein
MRFAAFEDAWEHIREHYAPDEPHSEEKFEDLFALPVVNSVIIGFEDAWPEGVK